MPAVTVVDHPLVADRLRQLRDRETPNEQFRRRLGELSALLVYEACRGLPTVAATVTTPLADAPARQLDTLPLVVPVLRAGLGMLGGALELLGGADVGFVGLRRDERTLQPDSYVTTVPARLDGRAVLVLDPMLATGGSLVFTLELLSKSSPGPVVVVCVLAAPEGLARVDDAGFGDVSVVTAAVDDRLNEVGFIVPGLGDAGDRQFGRFEP